MAKRNNTTSFISLVSSFSKQLYSIILKNEKSSNNQSVASY